MLEVVLRGDAAVRPKREVLGKEVDLVGCCRDAGGMVDFEGLVAELEVEEEGLDVEVCLDVLDILCLVRWEFCFDADKL